MTLLLIFEALDNGKINLDDTVTVSEHAASMGGSQVFLEVGETQDVNTLIKCIAVSSANDASVAMGEYISGSEPAFVNLMNQRAKELKMKQTHFVNCCGLDAEGHYTSAKDIAIMSRELTVKHPKIFEYTGIWMDTITHITKKGTSKFVLSNTNKLIKQYNGATGLKTGSTSKAGFCLSATATRDSISLIGVVMGCESSKARVQVMSELLDYGFSRCHLYKDDNPPKIPNVMIHGGTKPYLIGKYRKIFSSISTENISEKAIKKSFIFHKKLKAPIKKGEVIGKLVYQYQGKMLGSVPIISTTNVPKATYFYHVRSLCQMF